MGVREFRSQPQTMFLNDHTVAERTCAKLLHLRISSKTIKYSWLLKPVRLDSSKIDFWCILLGGEHRENEIRQKRRF